MDSFDPYEQWLGIGADERPIDYYRLLGVSRFEEDSARIAAAAEARMRHVRTFQTGPRGVHTQKILNELSRAKLRLLDPSSKAEYDRRLHLSAQAAEEFAREDDLDLPEPVAAAAAPPVESVAYAQPVSPPAAMAGPATIAPVAPRIDLRRPVKPRPIKSSQYLWLLFWLVTTIVVLAAGYYFGRDLFAPKTPPAQPPEVVRGAVSPEAALPPHVARQDAAGTIRLTPKLATIVGETPKLIEEGSGGAIADWSSADDRLEWTFQARKSALFQVTVTYAPFGELQDARLRVELPDQSKEWDLRAPDASASQVQDVQLMNVAEPGVHTLKLRLIHPGRNLSLAIYSVELLPFRGPTSTSPSGPESDESSN